MRLSRQIFSYSAFNIANSAAPFLLLPILTAYLLPKEFGVLSLVLMLQAFLLPIVLISFQGLVLIEYSKLTHEQFISFIGSIVWVPVFGFMVATPWLFVFSNELAGIFKIPEFWVEVSSLFVLLQALPLLMPVIFQAKQQVIIYGFFKIGMTLLNILSSLFFVICMKHGWEGRMWGLLNALVIFNAISLVMLFRQGLLTFKIELQYFKGAVMFGLPLIPHAISGIMLSMSDRLFLVNFVSKEAVGIYGVAYQIASAVMIVMSSVNQAWVPHLFQQLNNSPSVEQKKHLVKQSYKIMGLMFVGTIVFIAIIPVIYHLLISANYHGGVWIAILVSVALLFQGFYFMVTNYIFYAKKTYLLAITTLISAASVMALNYLLIPIFGIFGSAYAMLISWVMMFLLAWWVSHRVYPMPWWAFSKGSLND